MTGVLVPEHQSEPTEAQSNRPVVRVLVIDDDEEEFIIAKQLLREADPDGYVAVWCPGDHADATLQSTNVHDCCLLDYRLGSELGTEVLRRYRRAGGQIPVILVTGHGTSELDREALAAGADEFLPKSNLSAWSLDHAIRYCLERRRTLQALEQANSRLRRDLTAAAAVQRMLIPKVQPDSQRLDWAWAIRPTEELCGDAFDVFRLDDRHLVFYQLDVSGHGVPAAMIAVQVNRLLSPSNRDTLLLDQQGRPVESVSVLHRLNEHFLNNLPVGLFFTMLYGLVDEEARTVELANAGHCRPLFLPRSSGQVEVVHLTGTAIGIVPDPAFGRTSRHLARGDRLIVHSDGLIEASPPGNNGYRPYGQDRLCDLFAEALPDEPLDHLLNRMLDDVARYCLPGQPVDDCTLMAFSVRH